ncbi:3-deoxy-manno-octulosonate cytidylyltransferase [Flavobacteriaceae bacterium]|jgi:3-deoxy-manno-octulosonate cytidylyltransferase (CMP-KDO synthetase)|nr:3-deoxy-manno-octulosonate cytidylyltransferase [Flavobacteriaceae bacterium]MDB2419966.1 3-deoxy-manno-octulosonate cytidylyltransferase [Flavobacteriaceae bacterium]
MKKVIVIPARLDSSRLPKKVLLDLKGKTVIQRVYEQCLKVKNIDGVYIATDSTEIEGVCRSFTDHIILTKSSHQSGTDRIGEAVLGIDCDIVVNVQGDEPFIDPNLIEELVHSFDHDQVSMASAMSKIENIKDLQDPNVVKVVVDTQNNAIYFSRAPIPFPRDHQEIIYSNEELKKHNFFRHIGIYGYQKDFLAKYIKMEQTNLEKLEKLEQLRVIENGFKIKMIEAASSLIGIDTQEDYEEALKKY